MDKRLFFFMITVLILAALACNASAITMQETTSTEVESEASAGEQPVPEEQAPEQGAPEEQAPEEELPVKEASEEEVPVEEVSADSGNDPPASQPAALPIGLREGLASFNSFRLTMNTINNGPTAQDRDESRIEVSYNADEDARHMRTESVTSSAEYPEEEISVEDQYQVGLSTCTISSEADYSDVSTEELTALQRDMTESTSNLFDIIITIENPTLVGEETVNGIPANHFTFDVPGLGDYSGEEVTLADGEYWVALDGQYLVKYALALEVTTGPEGDPATEVMHSEYSYDLLETNQPVNISMPPECTS